MAGKKHRFDDTKYLEQSREIVDGVRSVVSVALLKMRKKAKAGDDEAENGAKKAEPGVVSVVLLYNYSISSNVIDIWLRLLRLDNEQGEPRRFHICKAIQPKASSHS